MDLVKLNLNVEPRLYSKHRKRVNTSFIFLRFFLWPGSFRSAVLPVRPGSAENESFDWLSAKTTIDCEAPIKE
jgi:hypothetical protein